MGHFLLASLLVAALVPSMRSQTCQSSFPSECYFTGAATRLPGRADTFKYVVIGGLFDVHEAGTTAYQCSDVVNQMGILNLQAFFWAIDKYARDLNDIAVGAVAFDSCMRPEQSIENLMGFAKCKLHISGMSRDSLVAFVGPYSNEDARRTGKVAMDLGITLLSPSANALDLSPTEQNSLLKLTPSFMHDLRAIVYFLQMHQSDYAIILYDGSDTFWKAAYDELTSMMNSLTTNKVCVRYARAIVDSDFIVTNGNNALRESLTDNKEGKYIIPLMSRSKMASLFSLLRDLPNNNRFIYILNSQIGRDKDLMVLAGASGNNAIILDTTIPVSYATDLTSFITHINNVRQNISNRRFGNVENPWIGSYASQLPNLSDDDHSYLRLTLARTIQAVSSIINGVKEIISDCNLINNAANQNQFCDKYRNQRNRNDQLYQKMRNAVSGLDANTRGLADSAIQYSYYRYNTSFSVIGSYSYQGNEFVSDFTQNLLDSNMYGSAYSPPCAPPGSCCSPPTTTTEKTTMAPSAITNPVQTTPDTSKMAQVMYPSDQKITGAFSDDDRDDSEYGTRFDLNHKWIIALGVLAGLGILCVLIFEIYILFKLLGTRAGTKWRTMWLGQLLLFGIFLCYLVLFAYLFIPTKATCGITRFGVGVAYATCFAVLLVKLMVILTSKPSDVLLPGDVETPNYLKGIYQFLMFIFAVGVQVVIDIQWLITVPPEAIKVYLKPEDGMERETAWICNHYTWEASKEMKNVVDFERTNFENHLLSLIYIMVLIVITTFLALKAHGIITNHRESVFIGIAAGFSIPIWLAWGLVGGLNKDHKYGHEYGDACIAFGLFLTATLILFAMFLPKVRQLVNMGVEGIYLEDDRDTYYAGSVIMAPPSYKSNKGPSSVIYVNNQGIYSEPVVIGNGDPMATHLKYPSSTYSAPPTYLKKAESAYGGSTRVLRVTDDLKGGHPKKRPMSEVAYGSARPRSYKGTLPRSRSSTNLGAL